MSNLPRILVCHPLHPAGVERLRQAAIVDIETSLSSDDLQAIIGQYQAIIVGPNMRLPHYVIEAGYNLRVIGCAGSRLDHVDVSTARAVGVEVRTSPSSSAVAVAEHTMTHMLLLAMQAARHNPALSAGLAGKTLGIIGFGLIGQQVARRALSFDMRVIVNQPRLTPELALEAGVVATDLIDLLRKADFVSLHVPFKAETETLIGAAELGWLKPTACLINLGHTDLVDDAALLAALDGERLAGAALPEFPPQAASTRSEQAALVRRHPRVLVAPHVTHILGSRQRDADIAIAEQVVEILRVKRPNEALSLEVVPVERVTPHEQIDNKRVDRLMESLKMDGRLVNPPVATYWNDMYVILDGATRYTALQRLGYPHVILQVIDAHRDDFTLHTWYHAISSPRPGRELLADLAQIPELHLAPLAVDQIQHAFARPETLCYFLDRTGEATLALAAPGSDRLHVMNELVARYTRWGSVERTLLTDLSRLLSQFPQMTAVAIFPQFTPETVFTAATEGNFLPAGLTRFVIPGRILRLNADLERLKQPESLAAKRAWFNQWLADKLARSRLRYYQEPVILLDE